MPKNKATSLRISYAHRSVGEDALLHLTQPADCPPMTQRVLAACHSLVLIDHELIGDPLEKAALSSVGWNLTRGTVQYMYSAYGVEHRGLLIRVQRLMLGQVARVLRVY